MVIIDPEYLPDTPPTCIVRHWPWLLRHMNLCRALCMARTSEWSGLNDFIGFFWPTSLVGDNVLVPSAKRCRSIWST